MAEFIRSLPKKANWRLRAPLLVFAILGLGVYIRFYRLAQPSLWMDEAAAFVHAKAILAQGYPLLPTGIFSWEAIPFHYLLALPLAVGLDMHWALRLWPAIAGVVAIYLTFLVSRQLTASAMAGLLAAFLMAFLDFQIEWSRQGKVYTVLQCTLLCVAWLVLDRQEEGRPGRAVFAIILAFLAITLHRAGYWALLLLGLDVIFRLLDKIRKREAIDLSVKIWGSVLLGGLFLAAIFRGPSGLNQTWDALKGATSIVYGPVYSDYLFRQLAGFLFLAIMGAAVLLVRTPQIGGLLVLCCLAYFGVISFKSHLFAFRYLLPLVPFICIFAAVPFSWLSKVHRANRSRSSLALLCLLLGGFGLWGVFSAKLSLWPPASSEVDVTVPRPDWRMAAALIRNREMQVQSKHRDRIAVASALPTVVDAYLEDVGVENFYLPINMTGYPGEDLWVSYYAKAEVIRNIEQLQNLKGYLLMDDFSLQSLLDPALMAALAGWPPDAIISGDFPIYIWILDGLPKL